MHGKPPWWPPGFAPGSRLMHQCAMGPAKSAMVFAMAFNLFLSDTESHSGGGCMGTMIDTLGYVKKLTAVGISREQAEAHAEALRDDLASQVVTKIDLAATEQRLDSKIAALDGKLDSKFLTLDSKVSTLEVRLEGKITLLHWMVGFNLAATMAVLWRMMR
jgi:hypothetical protein